MPGLESDKREPGHYPDEEKEEKNRRAHQAEEEDRGIGGRKGREGETPVATADGGFWSWFRRRR